MNTLENYIRANLAVSSAEMDTIASNFTIRSLDKGEYFVKKGKYCDKVGFILSGYIRVFTETEEKEVTQWVSSPGYFVTDLSSFVKQVSARWSMQALTPSVISEITFDRYEKLRKSLAVWNELDRLFMINCFYLMENRIFNHLYMNTEDRFNLLIKEQPELFNIVPLQYLASMLGMTPETLSRLRKKKTNGSDEN